jgi:hypothetical protein
MRIAAASLLAALAGCSSGIGLDVDVEPGCAVGFAQLEIAVTIQPSGDAKTVDVDAASFFAGSHRIAIVVPDGATQVFVQVRSVGPALWSGSATIPVSGSGQLSQTVTLMGPCPSDQAVPHDLAGADTLPPPDQSEPVDLALADLAGLADLSYIDLSLVPPGDMAQASDLAMSVDMAVPDLATPSDVGVMQPGLFHPQAVIVAGTDVQGITTDDYDNDGRADLAVLDVPGSKVKLLRGNGDGTFAAAGSLFTGNGPSWILSLTFPLGIGPSLVVSNAADSTFDVWVGQGNFMFPAPKTFPIGTGPSGLAVGNFNGGGVLDFAASNLASGISVSLGNGTTSYQVPVAYGGPGALQSIVAGDWNRDGKIDLAAGGSPATNNVSVYIGNGDGSFKAAVNYPAGTTPWNLCAADVDADNIIDLIVPNQGDGTVSVLQGLANGTFTAPASFSIGMAPYDCLAADLSGDGRVDLAVTLNGEGMVAVMEGAKLGGFMAPTKYAVGKTPERLVMAQLNGDGQPDLAVTNGADGTVSILLHQ